MKKLPFQKDFCKQVLDSDICIRFAGIADKRAKIVATEYRKGTTPFLSKDESVLAFVMSVVKMRSEKALQRKLGQIVCTFTLYEKVVVATLPLTANSYLMISFDQDGEHEKIILNKILPLILAHR